MLSPFFLLKSPALKKRKKIQSSFRALFCCINLKVAIFCKIVYLQKCVNAPLPYFVFFYKVQRNALFCCTFLIIKFRLMLMMFIKKKKPFFLYPAWCDAFYSFRTDNHQICTVVGISLRYYRKSKREPRWGWISYPPPPHPIKNVIPPTLRPDFLPPLTPQPRTSYPSPPFSILGTFTTNHIFCFASKHFFFVFRNFDGGFYRFWSCCTFLRSKNHYLPKNQVSM